MLAWLCFPAWATPPGSITATYEVLSHGTKIGQIEEIYQRDQDQYTLTSTTTPLGILAWFKPQKVYISSSGLIDQQGLRPLHFVQTREGDESKTVKAEFNWPDQQLTLSNTAQSVTLALPPDTQDRLSAMYQFMFLALEHRASLDFAMTNGTKLDHYHYAIGRREKLLTPAGKFSSLYLDSQAKPGENRTEIWLATQHHNLPCKMIITDAQGEQITQVLSQLKITP
jgi:hypothetical protein